MPAKSVLCIFAVIIMMPGCTHRARKQSLPVSAPAAFSVSGTKRMPDRWWTVFNDRELNTLVEKALESNLTLKAAWQRLREARAIVRREKAPLLPSLDGVLKADKSQSEKTNTEAISLELMAEYEIDLWGRIRANTASEHYRAKAGFADYQTAALSVSAEIVRTWYRIMETHSHLTLLEKQIRANEKILSIIKARFGSGQTRTTDILRQKQLLESTREQYISAESGLHILLHKLAVLLGKPPRSPVTYTHHSLPDLPPLPETGLPVKLVKRRPDVQKAFYLLKSADKDIASAISEKYPRLTLSFSLNATENNSTAIFNNWAHAFAAHIVAPLLDAGRRNAEVERTRAVKNQRLYAYGQSILTAFREVEDALILEKKQKERINSLKKQVRLAAQTTTRLKNEYLNGTSDYIDVLVALNQEQNLRRDFIREKMNLLEYRIALYRALAGGFKTKREDKT